MQEDIIQTLALEHQYPNGILAIRDINLAIRQGDYIALIGKNGSGKSTLAKHFNGLLRPTKGKVMVGGLNTLETRSEKLARVVGYVFQNPDYMLFSTTIEQEVQFGPKNLKLPSEETKARVENALEVTGLARLRKESPLFFGKGIRRMITIASILSMNPSVMVIDEPTTGMDFRGTESVMTLIDRLNQLGKTIIIITHDMKVVATHSKRVLVMADGQLMLDCPTIELFNDHDEILNKASLKPPERIQLARELGLKTETGEIPSIEVVSKKVREKITAKH
ncbi:MAG: energy-coupling factor ABC transporter ATP-binding protein [Nitrososphaerales archaeon]